jgi:tetratricopeptide (TPR) repeat protein
MAKENWDDHDRSGRYVARDFAYNYLNSCAKNAIIFTNGDNDTFPLWYAQEVEGIRTDVRVMNLSYLSADWYIEQMHRKAYESDPVPLSLTLDKYRSGKRDVVYIIDRIKGYSDLLQVMDFVASDDPRTKQLPDISQTIDFIPTPRFIIPVDTSKVLKNGTVSRANAAKVTSQMAWELEPERNYVTKNHLMILDLLATNNWERPIYYAITVSEDNYLNLDKFFQMEGLAYRIVPFASTGDMFGRGGINSDVMYENMVNKFRWGGVNDTSVYLDENVLRMLGNFRSSFARLALQLIAENKKDSARKTLEKCLEVIPDKVVPFNVYNILLVEAYYRMGDTVKANQIVEGIKKNVYQDMNYFASLGKKYMTYLMYEKRVAFYTLDEIRRMATTFNQPELAKEMEQKIQEFASSLNIGI